MIDVQLLRTEIDAVAKRLATRGYTLDITGFKALEEKRREIQTATEQLQSQRNALAKQVGQAKAKKRSEEHTSELQSPDHLVCRLLLEKKKKTYTPVSTN